MANINSYVEHYKNFNFDEVLLNEVDALIFTQLAYINFNFTLPKQQKFAISLANLHEYYGNNSDSPLMKSAINLLNSIKDTKRFKDIKAYNYEKIVNDDMQFSALTFSLPDKNKIFIAFEGTDTSIVGWKEDLQMVYQFPVPAQTKAIEYINRISNFTFNQIYLGGHSKGGNLAMTAAMYAKSLIKRKIVTVYNFDGQGFLETQYRSKEYQEMSNKLKMFVPSDAVVGLLLHHNEDFNVIKSSRKGIIQHDASTWEVFGGMLVRDQLSSKSKKLELDIQNLIDEMTLIERHNFVFNIFSVFDKVGIKDTTQIKLTKLNQVIQLIKELTNIDKKTKDKLLEFIKIMSKIIT